MFRHCAGGIRCAPLQLTAWILVTALLLAACGQAADSPGAPSTPEAVATAPATPPSTPALQPSTPDPTMAGGPTVRPTADPVPTADPPTPAAELPDDPWRTAELRDVRTGETFTINSLAGRLVVIEPMAIWCTNCRAQQDAAVEALASLDSDEIVYISLDVDPNETEADLARYADERGYPWHFVVASREVARSLAQAFGDQILSPPSTPEVMVTPDGLAEASFGFSPAGELEERFSARLP